MQKYYKRISQLRSNDGIIAKAWENSPTGKRDGRYWNQLTDPEKELMKKDMCSTITQKFLRKKDHLV